MFDIDPDIAVAKTLPARVYSDPAIFRAQRDQVFAGWLRPHKVVKPGPREMTVDEFLDRIEPAIKELDAEKKSPTREPSRREDQFLRRITARPPSATSWPLTEAKRADLVDS